MPKTNYPEDAPRIALANIIDSSGKKRVEVAEQLEISEQKLSKLLNGSNRLTGQWIVRILNAVDVDWSVFAKQAEAVSAQKRD